MWGNTMRKTILLAAGLLAACELFRRTWLEVHVGGHYHEQVFEKQWPGESGKFVPMNNSLTDSAGLAGIEIEIFAPGTAEIRLTAADFELPFLDSEPFAVPEEGSATVFVTLHQAGVPVAMGSTSWTLRPNVSSWEVLVERAPSVDGVLPENAKETEPLCVSPWCHSIRRIEIDEAARNYPDEALWLMVHRHIRGGWEG